MSSAATLLALGKLLGAFPGLEVVEGTDLDTAPVAYADRGLATFPLGERAKTPLHTCPINRAHKLAGRTDRCRGGCGHYGHGLLDASTNIEEIVRQRAGHPLANIGAPVPAGIVVLDIDPRSGGDGSLRRLIDANGPLPATLRARSGGKDGGSHLWFLHPGGRLRTAGRPELAGVDLRVRGNYVVVDPSIHPDGGSYSWVDPSAPIAELPGWLVEALRAPVIAHPPRASRPAPPTGDSIADWYTEAHTWWDVLGAHGWQALDPDGTRWRHPNATSALSAAVSHDVLFVFSTNTPFEPTGGGDCHGYTKFRAWAVLDNAGDLSAAARAARRLRNESRAA